MILKFILKLQRCSTLCAGRLLAICIKYHHMLWLLDMYYSNVYYYTLTRTHAQRAHNSTHGALVHLYVHILVDTYIETYINVHIFMTKPYIYVFTYTYIFLYMYSHV